jgi:general secretion pathway protein M
VKIPPFLTNLSVREKTLIVTVFVLLSVFLVFQFVYVPLLRSRDAYRQSVRDLESRLGTMQVLAETYASDRLVYDRMSGALRRKRSLSVLTYLENESQRSGVRDQIEYIRPGGAQTDEEITTTVVEMKIDAIGMNDMIVFLANVERNREGLVISYLRLKPFFQDRSKVDAVVRVRDVTIE